MRVMAGLVPAIHVFPVIKDADAEFPALAARQLRAAFTSGGKCVLEMAGLAPQTTMPKAVQLRARVLPRSLRVPLHRAQKRSS